MYAFQRAQGHIDCKIEVNAGPNLNDERNKLTIQFVFKYNKNMDGSKLNTFLQITKPLSDINITLSFLYVNKGSAYRVVGLVQYATGKTTVSSSGNIRKIWKFVIKNERMCIELS